jgi:hypothetical protein
MIASRKNVTTMMVQRGFLAGILTAFVLVLVGWGLFPHISLLGVAGVSLVLLGYAAAGTFGFVRVEPELLRLAGGVGGLAGLVYISEIILEYVVLPKDNSSWGLVEFGCVFGLFFLSALLVTARGRSIKKGLGVAVMTSMLSAVAWLVGVLLVFYLLRGSPRQALVLAAEGNFEDFARSGMSDLNTFLMEDFLGAGFFHLLLAPLVAVVLGTLGALAGKGLWWIRNRRSVHTGRIED